MKPPICAYCNSESGVKENLEFHLVYFKETKKDRDWYQKSEEFGYDGHPPNVLWFCEHHIFIAKKHETLHLADALRKMKCQMGNFFESPENAVLQITELLLNEQWEELSGYYDLSDDNIMLEELTSGKFFVRTKVPEIAHPGGFWRYKQPFSPGFICDFKLIKNNIITVYLKIEIGMGEGRVQKGVDSFKLKKFLGLGYKILLPDTSSDPLTSPHIPKIVNPIL